MKFSAWNRNQSNLLSKAHHFTAFKNLAHCGVVMFAKWQALLFCFLGFFFIIIILSVGFWDLIVLVPDYCLFATSCHFALSSLVLYIWFNHLFSRRFNLWWPSFCLSNTFESWCGKDETLFQENQWKEGACESNDVNFTQHIIIV